MTLMLLTMILLLVVVSAAAVIDVKLLLLSLLLLFWRRRRRRCCRRRHHHRLFYYFTVLTITTTTTTAIATTTTTIAASAITAILDMRIEQGGHLGYDHNHLTHICLLSQIVPFQPKLCRALQIFQLSPPNQCWRDHHLRWQMNQILAVWHRYWQN